MFHISLRRLYSVVVGRSILLMLIRSSGLMMLFCSSLLIFCLLHLLVTERAVFSATIVDLSISMSIQYDSGLVSFSVQFLKTYLFTYLFLAVLGLRCCVRAFSSCGERGLLFIVVRRLLNAVASLVAEHGL